MHTLTVVNMKCGGCEKKITSSLLKAGLSAVAIDVATQSVSFEGSVDTARSVLSSLGYPEAGTPEAQSILKKGHSYLSCALGRISS